MAVVTLSCNSFLSTFFHQTVSTVKTENILLCAPFYPQGPRQCLPYIRFIINNYTLTLGLDPERVVELSTYKSGMEKRGIFANSLQIC